jgi:hypothetical protein
MRPMVLFIEQWCNYAMEKKMISGELAILFPDILQLISRYNGMPSYWYPFYSGSNYYGFICHCKSCGQTQTFGFDELGQISCGCADRAVGTSNHAALVNNNKIVINDYFLCVICFTFFCGLWFVLLKSILGFGSPFPLYLLYLFLHWQKRYMIWSWSVSCLIFFYFSVST